jgi:hypothetical protein
VRYEGKLCVFNTLLQFWENASFLPERPGDWPVQSIHLDASGDEVHFRLPSSLTGINLEQNFKQHQVERLLVELYGEKMCVLLIGRMKSSSRGRIHDFWVALMVLPQVLNAETRWLRLGICIWESAPESLVVKYEAMWS